MDLRNETIKSLHEKIVNRKISLHELAEYYFARIEKDNPTLNAYLITTKNLSEKLIKNVESNQQLLSSSLIAGIPCAIKDNMNITGEPTTCASRILKGYVAPFDSTAVKKLLDSGAIVLGKTNLDEFAMGSSTENSAFGPTKNPRDITRVPGGSSGGSAAVVAADLCMYSLGSDTGGSIRQPASFCGVVGMKPTYGRVSRYGLVAFASSLDQIGPFTKTVEDCAIVLNHICGFDPHDATSVKMDVPDFTRSLSKGIKKIKIALPKELFGDGIDGNVKESVMAAVKAMEKEGAHIREVSMPSFTYALSTYYLVATAEASANLARFDGVRYGLREKANDLITMYKKTRGKGFGPEVKRRIMLGTYALSSGYYDAYYLKAQKVRTLIKQDYDNVFKDNDVIITPTSPTVAFKFGEKVSDPLSMYLSDIATIPVNLAGLPGISIPCAEVNSLPVGLQITGKLFAEDTVLQVAAAWERLKK